MNYSKDLPNSLDLDLGWLGWDVVIYFEANGHNLTWPA